MRSSPESRPARQLQGAGSSARTKPDAYKFPDLPELWAKYADKGGPDLDLPAYVQQGYFRLRIRHIKSAIVRGRATEGDLKFLEHAIQYVAQITIRMGFRLQNARKLEGYLKAEGMIGKNPAVVARERARSEAFHSRMEETLGQWGEEMLLKGDPGLREQRPAGRGGAGLVREA